MSHGNVPLWRRCRKAPLVLAALLTTMYLFTTLFATVVVPRSKLFPSLNRPGTLLAVGLLHGGLVYVHSVNPHPPEHLMRLDSRINYAPGLCWYPQVERDPPSYLSIVIPLWPLWLLGLWIAIRPGRNHHNGPTNYCGQCGYDRTGLRDAKCPECGES